MPSNFIIKALDKNNFTSLFSLSAVELEKQYAQKIIVNVNPGYPCRVSLLDAAVGDEVILLNYDHHKSTSPYKATGAIFVNKNAETAILEVNEIPQILKHRLLSLRCYNTEGMMKDAYVVEGSIITEKLQEIFTNNNIAYIHIHNAKPGCYNCVAERV